MTPEQRADAIASVIQSHVDAALEVGVVVTCETVPKQPLAMRNYEVRVEARPSKDQPKFCNNCDTVLPRGCEGVFADENSCAYYVFDLDAMCKAALARINTEIKHSYAKAVLQTHRDFGNARLRMHDRHVMAEHRAYMRRLNARYAK